MIPPAGGPAPGHHPYPPPAAAHRAPRRRGPTGHDHPSWRASSGTLPHRYRPPTLGNRDRRGPPAMITPAGGPAPAPCRTGTGLQRSGTVDASGPPAMITPAGGPAPALCRTGTGLQRSGTVDASGPPAMITPAVGE